MRDLRDSVLSLVRRPGFTLAVLLTLGLGIGATSAVFSVVEAVLLRPLPYPEAERIVRIWGHFTQRELPLLDASDGEIIDYTSQSKLFAAFGAYLGIDANLSGDGDPERLPTAFTNADFFRVLGMEPLFGRVYTAEEDKPGGPEVVVLSHGLWQRRFAGDRTVIGQSLEINGRDHTILGVMPPAFDLPRDAQLWRPLQLDPANQAPRSQHYVSLIARLKDGVSFEQAWAEIRAIGRTFEETHPPEYPTNFGWDVELVTLPDQEVGDSRTPVLVLLAAVGLVLLIACVNVTNLLLARALTRSSEMALRMALGASRGRLFRQLLVESVLLALAGSALGLLFAGYGVRTLLAVNPEAVARAEGVGVNPTILGFTIALALLTGVVVGLAPAFQTLRTDFGGVLRQEGGKTSAGAGQRRLRHFLVGLEVALALMLLISAGLMIKSFLRLTQVDPGFDADRLLTMAITLPASRYPDPPQIASAYTTILDRISAIPGVASASAVSYLPMSGGVNRSHNIGAEAVAVGPVPVEPAWRSIDYRYLETMGIALRQGRYLNAGDDADATLVAVVDEQLARLHWPTTNPLGRRVKVGPPNDENPAPWMTVVGVVAQTKQLALDAESTHGVIYYPLPQQALRSQYLVIRAEVADPRSLISAIRSEIRAFDPDQPVSDIATMGERLSRSVAEPRFAMLLLLIFAGVATVLAAVGIYSVVAYTVAQRTREIGIRQALGARRGDVFRMVVASGMTVALFGGVVGLLGAWWATRGLQSLLYDVTVRDPLIFFGVTLLLALVALLANALPAYRAARIQPAQALHYG